MKPIHSFTLLLLLTFVTGCQPDNPKPNESETTVMEHNDSQHEYSLTEGEFRIEGAWARVGMQGGMSAAYFTIANGLETDDVLLGAISSLAESTEIHETYEAGEGMMGMRQRPSLPIPSKSVTEFKQGGLHVMFIRLTEELKEGDEVQFILQFEQAGEVFVTAPVRMR